MEEENVIMIAYRHIELRSWYNRLRKQIGRHIRVLKKEHEKSDDVFVRLSLYSQQCEYEHLIYLIDEKLKELDSI